MNIPINSIIYSERIREAVPETIRSIAASIEEVGLLNPITVRAMRVARNGNMEDGYALISGLHRLEAAKSLGWTEIAVTLVDLIGPSAVIAECDENLCGANLTKAERALFTKHRKTAYEALHPETKAGHAGSTARWDASAKLAPAFTAETAANTGHSERTVQRDAARGDNIPDVVLKDIAGTSLDKGAVLDKLAKAPDPARALAVIRQERDQQEAHKKNRETDRTIALTEAQQFAQWLIERTDINELPQIISWLECCKAKDVTAALRRKAA